MNASSIDAGKANPQKSSSLSLYLGLLPVLLLCVAVLSEHLFPSSARVYEPRFLLHFLNSSLFLAAGVVAFIAMRIYLSSGSPTILWIGCGVLTLGTASLAAGWLIWPFGPNVNVTIFNVGAFLASICHMGAVMANLAERPGEADPSCRKRNVRLSYLAVLLGVALLVVLAITGFMPPFFIQGKGPTVIRQSVAGWAIVLFIVASLFTLNRFRRQRASFLYWYSLALALLALAMLAFLLQPAVGSPIGWVGRSSYVLAAVYFLLSVNSALREARQRGVGLSQALAELCGPGLHWQAIMATVNDAIVSYDETGEILLWNQAAERMFGYPEAEVKGKGIVLILPETKAIEASGQAGGITAIEPARQDGSRFSAEVTASSVSLASGVTTTLVIRDVTERRRAEREIQRLAAFPQMNPQPVLEMDMDGRITFHNQAALEALGKNGQAADLRNFLPGDLQEILSRAKQTGEKHFQREVVVNGAVFLESIFFDEQTNALRLYSVDITERQRAEAALRRAKQEWERTFDAVPDLIAILDQHHRIVRINRTMAEVLGAKPEVLIGRACYEVMHHASGPLPICPHSQLLDDGQEHIAELRELGRDFLVSASPLPRRSGQSHRQRPRGPGHHGAQAGRGGLAGPGDQVPGGHRDLSRRLLHDGYGRSLPGVQRSLCAPHGLQPRGTAHHERS